MTLRLPDVTSPAANPQIGRNWPKLSRLTRWRCYCLPGAVRTFFTGHRAYLGHTAAYNPASPSAYEIASTGRRNGGDAERLTSASSGCACPAARFVAADGRCRRAVGRHPIAVPPALVPGRYQAYSGRRDVDHDGRTGNEPRSAP